jgi:transaldolase
LTVIQEIGRLFEGTDKPISVEVNPHHDNWEDMVAEAEKLAAMCPNFVIKLPAIEAGFKAIPVLAEKGIRVNLTLVFSPAQALQAFRMGATFVSPFVGWKEANAEDILGFISEAVAIRDNYGYKGEIIVSAVRNGRQIAEAAIAGADITTAGLAVYKDAFDHPYTHVGLGKFQSFWDQTPYE